MYICTYIKPELPKIAPSPTLFLNLSSDLLTITLPGPTGTLKLNFQIIVSTKRREMAYYNTSKSWNIMKPLKSWILPVWLTSLSVETDHNTERGRNVTYHRLPPPSPMPPPSHFKKRLKMLLILGTWVFSGKKAALNLCLLPKQAQQLQLRKKRPFLKPFSFYPRQKREPSTYSSFSVLARQLLNIQDIFKSS